jgi:hypothetical protein
MHACAPAQLASAMPAAAPWRTPNDTGRASAGHRSRPPAHAPLRCVGTGRARRERRQSTAALLLLAQAAKRACVVKPSASLFAEAYLGGTHASRWHHSLYENRSPSTDRSESGRAGESRAGGRAGGREGGREGAACANVRSMARDNSTASCNLRQEPSGDGYARTHVSEEVGRGGGVLGVALS